MSSFGSPAFLWYTGRVDRLPSRSFKMARSFERGSMREVKVSLFLPQLLWVAIRRRAAMQGVSSLHLVRLALEAFEPDWREAELVPSLGEPEGPSRKRRDFPGFLSRENRHYRRVLKPREKTGGGSSGLLEGWDAEELDRAVSEGIEAARRARWEVWGRRALVVDLQRELNRALRNGQPSLFSAEELVG